MKSHLGHSILDGGHVVLDRWAKHIIELFEDHRNEYNGMKRNFAGPPLMKDQMQAAIRKIRQNNRPRQHYQ